MKTIILAGGLGTRLKSVVNNIPKPMADINGTPFLALLMDNMLYYGASEFILCVSYMHEKISGYFGDSFKGVPVRYSIESDPLGTGGAIRQAFELFSLENALVINGDSFIRMDYRKFFLKYRSEKLAMVLRHEENASRYGLVKTKDGRICGFSEKQQEIQAGYINAGIYSIRNDLFSLAPESKKFSFEKDILEKHITEIMPPYYASDGYFIDIGLPESYAQAQREMTKQGIGK